MPKAWISTEAVKTARGKGLTVHVGKIEDQRYSDDSVDLVLMNHVIEHVHDPLGALREIHRVLRPGGMLVVTTPNAHGWGHRRFGVDWVALDPPRHLRIFNANSLAALAHRAGFARSTVSSTLRITLFDFIHSSLIRRTGRRDMMRPLTRSEVLYGHAAAAVEMIMRIFEPMAADELLLEAWK